MLYKKLKDFVQLYPETYKFRKNLNEPEGIKLIILGESEDQRNAGSEAVKSALESIYSGSEINCEVQIIDLSKQENIIYTETWMPGYWDRVGYNDGNVLIPIFNNSGNFPDLAQQIFDIQKPGVLAMSQAGYNQVTNISKRNCYDTIRVD